ncbi:NUDIX domain-containing protein [Kineococcus sp. TBRC 1896]|uniref:8-oxo-dGTP diphosphatase n=1 Tax=Kineococcus mangrovi TaxID=1660183 RepID=A0ABM6QL05_9ACTN
MQTVVAGILITDERVLLTLRSATRRAYPSTWALPGGHVEPDEDELHALRRELGEELGIDVAGVTGTPISELILPTGAPDGPQPDVRLRTWHVTAWHGEPANLLPAEHERLAWFSAGELSQLTWAHPEHQQMLHNLLTPMALRHRGAVDP